MEERSQSTEEWAMFQEKLKEEVKRINRCMTKKYSHNSITHQKISIVDIECIESVWAMVFTLDGS